jgi:Putative zinc-finger
MSGGPVSGEHTDVAAYALGLLEPDDRRAFEEHLRGCPECAAELAELSGMKDLLSGIGPVEAPDEGPGEAEVGDLVRRRALAQRRGRRRNLLLAAAAAVVLVAGGVAAGLAAGSRSPAPVAQPLLNIAVHHTATAAGANPRTQVSGVAALVSKPFGTQVTLNLTMIGPLKCQIVAVSKAGARTVIATWFVPPVDFGVHDAHPPLFIRGWTTIKRGDLARIEIDRVPGGATA